MKMTILLLVFASTGALAFGHNEILDGHYAMTLKIGNRIFNDEMELKGADRPIQLFRYRGKVQGSITVPGVFTAPLEGHAFCSAMELECSLEFSILANEQGQTYEVRYKAKLNVEDYLKVVNQKQQPVLIGSAFQANGQLLGTFEAIRD